jgi:hypothetical protein
MLLLVVIGDRILALEVLVEAVPPLRDGIAERNRLI